MRITHSRKQWKAILKEQQTSGLNISYYCREPHSNNLREHSQKQHHPKV
jgi:hypothetical protein